MSKSNRCGRVLLAIFRVVQFLLSLIALACGIYITYTMYQMASSARAIIDAINSIIPQDTDDATGVELLQNSLVPVLKHLAGKPTRAIIVSVVAMWSAIFIIYLVFANRSTRKHYHRDLKRNSRTTRILLSLLMLFLWVAAIVCSALLVVQYGVFAVSVGPECKLAMVLLKAAIQEALEQAAEDNKTISNTLNIVNSMLTIGAMAIVLLSASLICGIVELISCFVACCVSGKATQQHVAPEYKQTAEKSPYQTVTTPVSPVQTSPYHSWQPHQSMQSYSIPPMSASPSGYYQQVQQQQHYH
ncbi:hypothetical protein BDV96DRAFT_673308 [Lophiotrema nucula]|uniref:Uncharacterized protein n=1 Tax=Lophiotrema nucula TaxID=690887 RepID=A0A6A5YJJ8_9PLEO|nr:hypothetical protein BDV96DRAFT_673308 [Lophiotrema nucula]